MVVFHTRLSSIEGHLPSKVVLLPRPSESFSFLGFSLKCGIAQLRFSLFASLLWWINIKQTCRSRAGWSRCPEDHPSESTQFFQHQRYFDFNFHHQCDTIVILFKFFSSTQYHRSRAYFVSAGQKWTSHLVGWWWNLWWWLLNINSDHPVVPCRAWFYNFISFQDDCQKTWNFDLSNVLSFPVVLWCV